MKLTKISLAAVVALGALSTSSFAGSLEESIKGVDVSGYVRYRFTSKTYDNPENSKSENEFKSHIAFSAPITDNVGVTVGALYKEVDATSAERTFGATTSADDSYNVDEYYATITPSSTKTTILAGKRTIGAPTTDDMKANGFWVLNSDISNVTLAGVYLDNLMTDGDATGLNALGMADGVSGPNLYAAAAILSFAPVSAQVWYFNVPETIDALVFAEVSADIDAGGAKIGVKGQYAFTDADSDLEGVVNDATFFGVEVTAAMDMFGLKAGFTSQEVDDAETGAVSLVSFEDTGAYICSGEQAKYVGDVSGFAGEWTTWFAGASVSPMKGLTVAADYIAMNEDISDEDVTEIVGTVTYKYNKNWKIKSYYSSMNEDNADLTTDKFRFEAKYSF